MPSLYLSQWEGNGEDIPFRPPAARVDQGVSLIDIRDDTSQRDGFCLVTLPSFADPDFPEAMGLIHLADIEGIKYAPQAVAGRMRSVLNAELGRGLSGSHPRDLLGDLFFNHHDLQPSTLERSYGIFMRGLGWYSIAPLVGGGTDPIWETFNKANGSLGPTYAWTDPGLRLSVVSNTVQHTDAANTTTYWARPQVSLDSDNVWATLDVAAWNSYTQSSGLIVRGSSVDDSRYAYLQDSGQYSTSLVKYSPTAVATSLVGIPYSLRPYGAAGAAAVATDIRYAALMDGSTIHLFLIHKGANGYYRIAQLTDTSISGSTNRRVGINYQNVNSGAAYAGHRFDDLYATSTLPAPVPNRTPTVAKIFSGGSVIDATSYTTQAYTPVADKLYVICIGHRASGTVSSVVGWGLTWTKVKEYGGYGSIWVASSGSAPTSGSLTINMSALTAVAIWTVIEVSDTNNLGESISSWIKPAGSGAFSLGAYQYIDGAIHDPSAVIPIGSASLYMMVVPNATATSAYLGLGPNTASVALDSVADATYPITLQISFTPSDGGMASASGIPSSGTVTCGITIYNHPLRAQANRRRSFQQQAVARSGR